MPRAVHSSSSAALSRTSSRCQRKANACDSGLISMLNSSGPVRLHAESRGQCSAARRTHLQLVLLTSEELFHDVHEGVGRVPLREGRLAQLGVHDVLHAPRVRVIVAIRGKLASYLRSPDGLLGCSRSLQRTEKELTVRLSFQLPERVRAIARSAASSRDLRESTGMRSRTMMKPWSLYICLVEGTIIAVHC